MVDVVFVLLLFFMASVGEKRNEGYFDIGLPSPGKADPGRIVTPIVVDVDALGNVFVNGDQKSSSPKDHDLKALEEFLRSAVRTSPDDPVIIRPSAEARHERVVDVLNVCRLALVAKLSFG